MRIRWLSALSLCMALLSATAAYSQSSNDLPERLCPICETPNRVDAKFCKNCGALLQQESSALNTTEFHTELNELTGDSLLADRLFSALSGLSRDELLQLVEMIEREEYPWMRQIQLPEGSVAAMSEQQLRSLIYVAVQGKKANREAGSGVGFFGGLLQVIGGVTLFLLLILLLSA